MYQLVLAGTPAADERAQIVAVHGPEQDVADKYPGATCVLTDRYTRPLPNRTGAPPDPEFFTPTADEIGSSVDLARRCAYGGWREQLDKLQDDARNGTNTWLSHCDAVRFAHPKAT